MKFFKAKVKAEVRRGRGLNVRKFVREILKSILRGWMNYYHITETKGVIESLDGWIRSQLRNVIWQ